MLQVVNVPIDPVLKFDKEGGGSPPFLHSFSDRYREAYLQEMETFLSLVLDPSLPCPVRKEEVVLSARIADACETSLKEGRVVTFDPV